MKKELLEKIKNLKTKEELQDFVNKNYKELSELDLDSVSGGTDYSDDVEKRKQQREEEKENYEKLLELLKMLEELMSKDSNNP